MPPLPSLDLFASTAPGLEVVAARELAMLGVEASPQPGGVEWRGGHDSLYRASLELRTASRVLVRVAEFKARSFIELERHLRRIEWDRWANAADGVRLRVTSRKSRLYHQRAIEERFAREIGSALGAALEAERTAGDGDEEDGEQGRAQLFVVRFLRDQCVVSADASGELLHRRGYRQAVARAPLRETLAAAMLLAGGWTRNEALLDPFCGSGTIPIEAALIARDIAPALATPDREPREFAFQRWPSFDPGGWDRLVYDAQARIRDAAGIPIAGSDRDAGAIEAARANATRAGVEGDVTLEVRALSAVEAPAPAGWLVANPPYGVRVGESAALRDLYAALGKLADGKLAAWSVAVLAADDGLLRQSRLQFEEVLRTTNGGIPVRLMRSPPLR